MQKMDLAFSKIVNRDKREIEMLLYGVIGSDINGHNFARELNYLGREFDTIKIRINSDGGSISEGLSIVSEMMASPAFIIAQVDGVAASMAAVILAAADRVVMNDYAKIMVHSPYYVGEDGNAVKNLSAKDRKGLQMMKNTLEELLVKRGIPAETVTGMMKTDSWFTSDEAKTALLVDDIIVTGRTKELAALEPKKLVALVNNEIPKPKNNNMKKIIAKLGLQDDATEDAVVAAIEKMEKDNNKAVTDGLIDQLILVGKKTGKVTDKNEVKVRKLAETDMELFAEYLGIDSIEKPEDTGVRLSDVLAELKKNGGNGTEAGEKDWDWYQKNDAQALAAMEVKEPEKFKKLQAAYESKFV